MENETLKVVSEEAKETEDAEKDYVDEDDIYSTVCRMSVIMGALTALNDGVLNKEDAKYTMLGCEYLSRDLISELRDLYEEVTK